ncbi:MAG: glucosidase [Phycisphaerales bacterium]|nr:glucosidase [Phycisphaerales bacterium]
MTNVASDKLSNVWATAEGRRLDEDSRRTKNWKRWGPYLSERQWATVREDYSPDGNCWDSFPHDHARSRAYRWGEDGLLGITDRECRLCFALALWNGKDPILKERMFGLTGPEGNHGEDVKEEYFYLDSTPTHSYFKSLYKYPHAEFPYAQLVEENHNRSRGDPEFELVDSGVFKDNRLFDVTAEYAKGGPNDILIRITLANRGPDAAELHVLPTLWYRNSWSWGLAGEGGAVQRPQIRADGHGGLLADDASLGRSRLAIGHGPGGAAPKLLFTENVSNSRRLWGSEPTAPHVKDAFHEYVVNGNPRAVNPAEVGSKAAAWYKLTVPGTSEVVLRLRLSAEAEAPKDPLGESFDRVFADRLHEADEFYDAVIPAGTPADARAVARQAYAGLLHSKQYYHYVVEEWLKGDPALPAPPSKRWDGRNTDWMHLFNRDIISMPDKWEYPWYAAWDLAFHMIPMATIDPEFAKRQLLLFLREWYMHPNGQLPAYEFAMGDVNPPVHAWACWRVYLMTERDGEHDRAFLARCFQKLLINFTWWVNRKDPRGKNLFAGGFLGLDNIGLFDRSRPLPTGGHLEQADGTAWMAFYCGTMLAMALELAKTDIAYEDMASKFFEHFVAIIDAMNALGGTGLWDEEDGFYYDQLYIDGKAHPMRVRSLVGIVPLLAVEVLHNDPQNRLKEFGKRTRWFLDHKRELAKYVSLMVGYEPGAGDDARVNQALLAVPSRERLLRVLKYMLDENEFLSPYGVRSVSKIHAQHPLVMRLKGEEYRVDYVAGESKTSTFGGNSNWRGPIWFPLNYLLVEALERYHFFYGDSLKVECPTHSGIWLNLGQVAVDLRRRLGSIFLPDAKGHRPCHGGDPRFADPRDRHLVLFHEYFHGDSGKGIGASHQTGWTALAAPILSSPR